MAWRRQVTSEIWLEELTLVHARPLFEEVERSRAYLRQWLPWVDNTRRRADSERFIRESARRATATGAFQAAIVYRGVFAGICGFQNLDRVNRKTKLGYWLVERLQGKGIMTRSVSTFTDYALREMRLNRVSIHAAPGNQPSRRIPERLGYSLEGVLKQNEWLYDHFVDHCVYGMLREVWLQRLQTESLVTTAQPSASAQA